MAARTPSAYHEFGQSVKDELDEALLLQELGRYAPAAVGLDNRLLNDPVINKPPRLRWPLRAGLVGPSQTGDSVHGCGTAGLAPPTSLNATGIKSNWKARASFRSSGSARIGWRAGDGRLNCAGQTRLFLLQFSHRTQRRALELWPDSNNGLGAVLVSAYLWLDINQGSGRPPLSRQRRRPAQAQDLLPRAAHGQRHDL
jgi:hypothetical protein